MHHISRHMYACICKYSISTCRKHKEVNEYNSEYKYVCIYLSVFTLYFGSMSFYMYILFWAPGFLQVLYALDPETLDPKRNGPGCQPGGRPVPSSTRRPTARGTSPRSLAGHQLKGRGGGCTGSELGGGFVLASSN